MHYDTALNEACVVFPSNTARPVVPPDDELGKQAALLQQWPLQGTVTQPLLYHWW